MPRELNIKRVREMEPEDMQARIGTLQEELFNLRFRNAMRQLDNPLEIRNLRRDLARLKTALRESSAGRSRTAEGEGK